MAVAKAYSTCIHLHIHVSTSHQVVHKATTLFPALFPALFSTAMHTSFQVLGSAFSFSAILIYFVLGLSPSLTPF